TTSSASSRSCKTANATAKSLRLNSGMITSKFSRSPQRAASMSSRSLGSIVTICKLDARQPQTARIFSKICGAALAKASRVFERVDFASGFLGADAFDARKAQREAARVAITWLHGIERDFEHDIRRDLAIAVMLRDRRGFEIIGELRDLGIGEAGVGFADG